MGASLRLLLLLASPAVFAAFSAVPSLRTVCASWLRAQLDKAEQCSDWDRRPLTEAQVAYAALDAAVLLRLRDAMGAR